MMIASVRRAFLAAALLLPSIAVAEELGRLFLTPERRAALERQRQLGIQETQTVKSATLSVTGVVRRGNGRTMTWINGVPQEESAVNVRVNRADPARTTVSADGKAPVSLKVGETVNRSTGEIDSGLGEGRIKASGR